MSMRLMVQAWEIKVGNSARKNLLLKLCDNANDDGFCWPSIPLLMDKCEMSKSSVIAHTKELVKMGLISKRGRKGVKGNSSNMYQILFAGGVEFTPPINTGPSRGAESAPPPSAKIAPPEESTPPRGAEFTPPSANSAPPPSAESAPGISHSFEPVIKEESALPVIAPSNLFAIDTSIVNKFSMMEDWQPTEKFTGQCKYRGVNLNAFSPDDQEDLINEFRSYWMTRSDQFNQAGWEHKLIANLKSNQDRKSPRNNPHSVQSKRANISAAIMDIGDTNW